MDIFLRLSSIDEIRFQSVASFAKQANKVRFLTFICKEVAFTELNWLRFAYCYYIVGFPRSTASPHVLNDNRQTYLPDGKTWKVFL